MLIGINRLILLISITINSPTSACHEKAGKVNKLAKCENCVNWIDGTSDCSIALKYQANNWDLPDSVEKALDLDKNEKHDCEEFKEA